MQDLERCDQLVTGYWKLFFNSYSPIINLTQIIVLYYYIRDFLCQTDGSTWQYLQFIENSMTAIWAKSESEASPKFNILRLYDCDAAGDEYDGNRFIHYPEYWTMYNKLSLTPINCCQIKYIFNFVLNKSIRLNAWIGFTNQLKIVQIPDTDVLDSDHVNNDYRTSWNSHQFYAGFQFFPSPYVSQCNHNQYFIRRVTITDNDMLKGDWNHEMFPIPGLTRIVTNRSSPKDIDFYKRYSKESHRAYGQMTITLSKTGGNHFRNYYTVRLSITENQDHYDTNEFSFIYSEPLKDIKLTISAPNEAVFSLQQVDIGSTPCHGYSIHYH